MTTKSTFKADALLIDLQKKFGDDKVMMAKDIIVGPPVSTGSLALDYALGYGGFPSNRVVEIYGREGTGKTTLSLLTMLSALRDNPDRGGLFLDVEHKIDKEWMELIVGKDVMDNRLIYIQPTSIENATNVYRKAVESGTICCAILDSIGGSPTVRRNDDAEVGHYGGNAMGVGEFARSAATLAAVHFCLTIGVNQVRAPMGMAFADNPPGGKAWGHACIQRVELVRGRDTETIKLPGEEKPFPIGYNIFAKVRKNQAGPPGRTAMYWFHHYWTEEFGFGVDLLDEVARLGLMTQVITQKGSWYHHPALPEYKDSGEHKIQGMPKVKDLVRSDESLYMTLRSEILAALDDHGSKVAPLTDPEEPTEKVGALMLSGGE